MTRRLTLCCALAAATATFAFASTASAVVYCVPDTTIDPSCDTGQAHATIQGALTAAAVTTGVADTVRVGPGTFTGPFSYSSVLPANTVQLIGSGTGQTQLTIADTTGTPTVLTFNAAAGSVVTELQVRLPAPGDGGGDNGIFLNGAAALENVLIDGPSATNVVGVVLNGTTSIDDSVIEFPFVSPGNSGVRQNNGPAQTITDTAITADVGATASGTTNTLTIERSTLDVRLGVLPDSGFAIVRDSLIDLGNRINSVGVRAANLNNSLSPIDVTVDGVTIVGGGANSIGVQAVGDSAPGDDPNDNTTQGETGSATVLNTVIEGPAAPLAVQADRGETASITTDYSNYDASAVIDDDDRIDGGGVGTTTLVQANQTDLAPGFANPGEGNYHLTAASPLIDIGDPADPGVREDLDGDPRDLEGTPPCVTNASGPRDIGADEYNCVPPETAIDTGPTGTTGDTTPTFGFSSEPGSTFECRFDADPFAPCSGPGATHTPATPLGQGGHTFEVRALDVNLNTDPTPAAQAFTIDTTPPDTTITSGPAEPTNDATPTFGFESEAGATFQCRFDAQPFAPCSGPGATHTPATPLGQGAHTFAVKAIDTNLNEDPTPATRAFSVDTVGPNTAVNGKLKYKTKKKRARVAFAFSASEAGGAFECRLDAAAFAPCTSPTVFRAKRGRHRFEVRAVDALKNADSTPAAIVFRVIKKKRKR